MKSTLLIALVVLAGLFSCQPAKQKAEEKTNEQSEEPVAKTPTLELKWATDTLLTTAESAIYYAEADLIFVANINDVPPNAKDGDGFISQISTSGEIIAEKWVENLDAPKGMGILNGKLYVTNIDELVEIDIETASISNRWAVAEAQFLNDISIDTEGSIFISDSYTNKIHVAKDGEVTTWLSDSTLGSPNGLLHQGDKLMLATFGSGEFKEINTNDKSIKLVNSATPGGDGIVAVGDDYLVSNWNGEVYFVTAAGESTRLLDTKDNKENAADIAYIADKNLLLVPTFFNNRVVAYELKK